MLLKRELLVFQSHRLAHILARKFDLYGKVTSSNTDPILLEGLLNGVMTCAYTDIIATALRSIWAAPDLENLESPENTRVRTIRDNLGSLNTILTQSSTPYFYDQTEPTVADYFFFEAYTLVRDIHRKLLPQSCDALKKLDEIMKKRPALAKYFQNGRLLKRLTAAPHEEEYLAKISQIK